MLDQDSSSTPVVNERTQGLLGLVMIVKDEASRVGPLVESLRDVVDCVTILDTGSTDGTQDVVRSLAKSGICCTLQEATFEGFAKSRNLALDLHGERTVFTLMLNVDPLINGPALRAFLEERRSQTHEAAYRVRLTPGHYFQTSVLRTACRWRYVGRTHEVPCGTIGMVGPVVPGVSVVVDRTDRPVEAWRSRWMRDLQLLEADMVDTPQDPRPVFYMAQTLECLGDLPQPEGQSSGGWYISALGMYRRRGQMGGFRDEAYEALFRVGRVLDKLGQSEADAAYIAAHDFDPRRAEPLHALALRYYKQGKHALTYLYARRAAELPLPDTDLFVDEAVYTWQAADLVGTSGYYLRGIDSSAFALGRQYAKRALRMCPGDERLIKNLSFYDA